MKMKGKATNEQLAKVLEYTLAEHQKNIEKSEKERTIFLNDFKSQIQNLEKISLKPNLDEFEQMNNRLERECNEGVKRINSAIKNVYFSPLILGIVFIVFLSGVGMLTYSFNKMEKANEVADAKELAIKNHILKFFKENPKSNKTYQAWREKE